MVDRYTVIRGAQDSRGLRTGISTSWRRSGLAPQPGVSDTVTTTPPATTPPAVAPLTTTRLQAIVDLASGWSAKLALIVAGVLAFMPVLLIVATGIWAPSAMTQEMFSHYYATRLVLHFGYFFVPTGHGFGLYNYPVSLVIENLFSGVSLFWRYHYFAIGTHLWNGTLNLLVFLVAWRLPMSATERWLLLVVGFAQWFVMRFMTFGLATNYHTLEQLLLLVTAVATIYYLFGGRTPSTTAVVLLGALAGVATGTKLSLFVLMGPLIGVVAMPWRSGVMAFVRAAAIFIASLIVAYLVLLTLYFQFRLDYFAPFWTSMVAYFSGPNLQQRTPFFAQEFNAWLDPASFYFGFQALATCWFVALIAAVWVGVRRPRWEVWLFLAANLPAIAVLGLQLWSRRTVGTMLDVALYLAFSVTTLAALCWRFGAPRRAVQWFTVAMLGACVIAMLTANPGAVFHRLIVNSDHARQIEAIAASHPTLPVVYYMDSWAQPLIFPAADFYGVVGIAPGEGVAQYQKAYFPRTRWASPANAPIQEPHVAIIPEYLDMLPRTPENLAEWPDMYPKFEVLGVQPALTAFVNRPENGCRTFQFVGQDARRLHALYGYATRVTVCVSTAAQ